LEHAKNACSHVRNYCQTDFEAIGKTIAFALEGKRRRFVRYFTAPAAKNASSSSNEASSGSGTDEEASGSPDMQSKEGHQKPMLKKKKVTRTKRDWNRTARERGGLRIAKKKKSTQ
jgi:hypothetical protein